MFLSAMHGTQSCQTIYLCENCRYVCGAITERSKSVCPRQFCYQKRLSQLCAVQLFKMSAFSAKNLCAHDHTR